MSVRIARPVGEQRQARRRPPGTCARARCRPGARRSCTRAHRSASSCSPPSREVRPELERAARRRGRRRSPPRPMWQCGGFMSLPGRTSKSGRPVLMRARGTAEVAHVAVDRLRPRGSRGSTSAALTIRAGRSASSPTSGGADGRFPLPGVVVGRALEHPGRRRATRRRRAAGACSRRSAARRRRARRARRLRPGACARARARDGRGSRPRRPRTPPRSDAVPLDGDARAREDVEDLLLRRLEVQRRRPLARARSGSAAHPTQLDRSPVSDCQSAAMCPRLASDGRRPRPSARSRADHVTLAAPRRRRPRRRRRRHHLLPPAPTPRPRGGGPRSSPSSSTGPAFARRMDSIRSNRSRTLRASSMPRR